MKDVKIYRKRIIPNEKILLKNDNILLMNEDIIVTKWKTLKDRGDFNNGCSCYFLKKNFKISKFMQNDQLVYWYCDIVNWTYDEKENAYTFTDMLIDVVIYENGFVKVYDLAELALAIETGAINSSYTQQALKTADELLNIIYSGGFDDLKKYWRKNGW